MSRRGPMIVPRKTNSKPSLDGDIDNKGCWTVILAFLIFIIFLVYVLNFS